MSRTGDWVKRRVSITNYEQAIFDLIKQIPIGKYEYCYGIPRGGLIPATYISYQLGLDMIVEYDLLIPRQKVLVVDDIADTGSTLEPFKEAGYDTACLFYKIRSTVKPTYYVHDASSYWIVFPYEKDDEPINREK